MFFCQESSFILLSKGKPLVGLYLECAGRKSGTVHKVSKREGLPAVASSCGVLHLARFENDGVALDFCLVGRVIEAILVGDLEGAQVAIASGVHTLGVIKSKYDALTPVHSTAYGRSRGNHVVVSIVVVQGDAPQSLSDGTFVSGVYVK